MSEIQIILFVQSISNSTIDVLFKAITYLGSETFYMLIVPIIYWCVSKKWGFRLSLLFSLSAFVNLFLKDLFCLPRPPASLVKILHNGVTAETPGFPSAHSQGTTTFWSYVAGETKKRFLLCLGVIFIILVSFSRVYLGLHYPHDVIGGILIGLSITFFFIKIYDVIDKKSVSLSLLTRMTISICLPLVLFAFYHTLYSAKVFGFLVGMGVGSTLENKYIRFVEQAPPKKQFLKGLVGLVVLFIIRTGPKKILPTIYLCELLRYIIMGLWVFFFAPLIFKKSLEG